MGTYRKKPIVIEAFQFKEVNHAEYFYDWFITAIALGKITVITETGPHAKIVINTLEGAMVAQPGDYIIKGIKGEIYPCKEDIFLASYEKVN